MKTKLQLKTILGTLAFEYEAEDNTNAKMVIEYLKKMKGEIIKEINFSSMDLSGVSFYNSRFDNSSFDNSSFYNSRFDNSRFDNSSFYNSSFYNSRFDNSRFDNSSFYNSSFYNSRFDNSRFDNSSFYNSSFYNSSFDNSRFDNSSFYNSSFDNSRFYNSRFDQKSMTKLIEAGYDMKEFKRDFFDVLVRSIPEIPMLIQALKDGKVNGTAYDKNSSTNCVCLQGTLEQSERYKSVYGTEQRDAARPIERYFYAIREGDTPEKSLVTKTALQWIEEFIFTITPFLREDIKLS